MFAPRAALTAACAAAVILSMGAPAGSATVSGEPGSAGGCQLGNGMRHVVALQFDNVHLRRDNPRVPSDLQQMPHLLHFLTGNGTLLSNDHDVLSHTATNVLSALTGLYPDRHGVTQSNSYPYYNPDGSTNPGVSFAYWTDPIFDPTGAPTDHKYNMIYSPNRAANPTGHNVNTPAPWVPYTRAGCDVGAVAASNTVLENIETDIPTVFGADSPEAAEVKKNPDRAYADFVGLAVHCARASTNCRGGQADALPDEPGGYRGHKALFGNKFVRPLISPQHPVTSLSGRVIRGAGGNAGFPGFDAMTPDNGLAYVADMQEHGVPVTYAYLSDAHTDHAGGTGDFGPGEAGYVAQLRAYDAAFATFLDRMRRDGITPRNTLFTVTTDEGDYFVGSPPKPAKCDGVTVPCSYAVKGEVSVNLPGLLATREHNTTPFSQHNDPAPAIYVTGRPDRTDPRVRRLEREAARLAITNPLTGQRQKVSHYLADSVEEKILHFVDADPARTPTFTMFGQPDEYIYAGAADCTSPCVSEPPGYAWNHGTISPDMTSIWLGIVGPGVLARGQDSRTWADQTDLRPTTLALLGLHDDYRTDGRVLAEELDPAVLPGPLRNHYAALLRLGAVQKQLLAGPGQFGMVTLRASTRALESGGPDGDATYARIEQRLSQLGAERDQLTDRIQQQLTAAEFGHGPVDDAQVRALTDRGKTLLGAAHGLAGA